MICMHFLAFISPRLNLLELIKDEFYEENVVLTYCPMDKILSCTISGLNIFAIARCVVPNLKLLIFYLFYFNFSLRTKNKLGCQFF